MKKLRRIFCLILCFLMVLQTGTTAYSMELTEPKTTETKESETTETKKPEATETPEPKGPETPETKESETTETPESKKPEPTELTEPTELEPTETTEPDSNQKPETKEPETTETKESETTETTEPEPTETKESETTETTEPDLNRKPETTETKEPNQNPEMTETTEMTEPEEETEIVFGIPRAVTHMDALSRVLAQDDFSSGSKWKSQTANTNSSVAFEDNMAKIKGSGKCNAISLVDLVSAKNFRIRMDMTLNSGHTNASVKAAFKMENQLYNSQGERLEVRFDTKNGSVIIQKETDNDSTGATVLAQNSYAFTLGETYGVDIDVADNTINVYINGTSVAQVTNTAIGTMQKGYFAVAGEFPAQDFGISNLDITTDEQQTGPEYTVTLVSATDGKMNDETGGTLTADVMKGYEGDRVKLTPSPKHGYVFDRYESFKEDGTGTDGHLPIADNSFAFNSKTGNVTVVAHFKTRVPGRFELFYDDFGAASLDPAYKTVGEAAGAVQKDGILTLDAKSGGANYLLLNKDVFSSLKSEEGYRISADIWKADTKAGTMQIAFRGADDSPNGRYVLVLNGDTALFKSAPADSDATSVELVRKAFTFNTKKVHVELEVVGKTVTFFADGKEILSYTSQDDWPIGSTAGLYNMTYGSKVCFDNFMVERMPEKSAVDVKVLLRENGADVEDTERKGGIAELSAYSAVEGDEITVTATAKAGYRLAECYIEENRQITVTDNKFVIPSGQKGTLTV